jgi:acyl-coenzyme A thioesterase PaaI-like protein
MGDVFTAMQAMVPFMNTLGIEEVSVDSGQAVLRLPDVENQRNHLGGPHAGAMFSVGESCSGIVVMTLFADTFDRAVPLPMGASIRYLKVAQGAITATARLAGSVDEVLATLDAGERPEFDIAVELTTDDGTVTGDMLVHWTLKPTS